MVDICGADSDHVRSGVIDVRTTCPPQTYHLVYRLARLRDLGAWTHISMCEKLFNFEPSMLDSLALTWCSAQCDAMTSTSCTANCVGKRWLPSELRLRLD